MSASNKIYKNTLSCRLYPQLKKQIQEEASDKELTTSNYIESILEKRKWILEEEERDKLTYENQHLETVVFTLEQELEEQKSINNCVVDEIKEKHQLLEARLKEIKQLKQQMAEMKRTSIAFDLDQLDELQVSIQELQVNYPEVTIPSLIIASLKASLKNEESILSIYLIEGQLK